MATYYIHSPKDLHELVRQKIAKGLLKFCANKIMDVMNEELARAEISTATLRDFITYEMSEDFAECNIFVDYEEAQFLARPPVFVGKYIEEWGQFTCTLGDAVGSEEWEGMPITFRLLQWTEEGNNGGYGNNPIMGVGWFTETERRVRTSLDGWVREYFMTHKIFN